MEGYGNLPCSIPYYGYYSHSSVSRFNSSTSYPSYGYGFSFDSRYPSYESHRVHDKWYQSDAPKPPVEMINQSQVRNEAVEDDGHLRALSQILEQMKEVRAETRNILNKIEELNQKWRKPSMSIKETIEELCENDGGEESVNRVAVDKGSKCDEYQVFEKITEPKFEVEHVAGDKETLIEMTVIDEKSLTREKHTTEGLLIEQVIVEEDGNLVGAVVGREVIAKGESEIDERQLFDKMIGAEFDTYFVKEVEKCEAENSIKGKKAKTVLDYEEQVYDDNNEIIKFSRKPKMRRRRDGLSLTPHFNFCYHQDHMMDGLADIILRAKSRGEKSDGLGSKEEENTGQVSDMKNNGDGLFALIGSKQVIETRNSVELLSEQVADEDLIMEEAIACGKICAKEAWDFETRRVAKELGDRDCVAAITSVCWSMYNHIILVSGEGNEDNSRGYNMYFNRHTNIVLPEEMRKVINLRLLNLMNCCNLKVTKPRLVSSLVCLEEKYMLGSFSNWEVEKERKYWRNATINELAFLSDPATLQIERAMCFDLPSLSSLVDRMRITLMSHEYLQLAGDGSKNAVEEHYEDITKGRFDFNFYCMGKITLRTYVDISHFQQISIDDRLLVHRGIWVGAKFEYLLNGDLRIAVADNDVKAFVDDRINRVDIDYEIDLIIYGTQLVSASCELQFWWWADQLNANIAVVLLRGLWPSVELFRGLRPPPEPPPIYRAFLCHVTYKS